MVDPSVGHSHSVKPKLGVVIFDQAVSLGRPIDADDPIDTERACMAHQLLQNGLLDTAPETRQLMSQVSICQALASRLQMITLIMPLSPKVSTSRT